MKVSHWAFFLTFIFSINLSSPLSQAAVVNGKVNSVQGEFIELDLGSDKGLNVGDMGRVYYMVTVGGEIKSIYVAKFKITFISDKASMARIEDKTGEVRVGNLVEIETKLGELEVNSDPARAKVYLDGKEIGETPVVIPNLRFGRYSVKIIKDRYKSYEEQIEVTSSERKNVIASLIIDLPKIFTNSIGMQLVLIPGDKPFYLGKYEVTQREWIAVMGNNPSKFQNCGEDCPVEQVSWNDVQEFINRLNRRENTDRYRLPTAREWIHACTAGNTRNYNLGKNSSMFDEYAWHDGNSVESPHAVGLKKPNDWGLYDMRGNVAEWTDDNEKTFRGGSWNLNFVFSNCSSGGGSSRNAGTSGVGFRLLKDL